MKVFQEIKIDYKKGSHILSLDGLRALAVLMVISYHYFEYPYGSWFSLDLFFVLSGFLITGILLDTKQNKNYFKNYFFRRMLRILPLYYGVLIAFFVITPLFASKASLAPFSIYYQNQGYFWSYLQNWILLFKESSLKDSSRIFLHLWSLGVEEQYYIVWPFLVLLLSTKKLAKVTLGLIIFSIALKCFYFFSHYSWQYNYFSTFTRLDALSIGGLVAIGVRDKAVMKRLGKAIPYVFKILLVLLPALLFMYKPTAPKDEFLEPFGTTIFAIFFASLLLYCMSPHATNYIKRIFELKILRFIGRFSYSMYIFHVPILVLMRPVLIKYLHQHISYELSFILSNLLCFGLTILASQISWYVIEKPALSLKRFFKYDIKSSEAIEQPPAVTNILHINAKSKTAKPVN